MVNYRTIDEYIAQYPADVQAICEQIRKTIRSVAPDAVEKISYASQPFGPKRTLSILAS